MRRFRDERAKFKLAADFEKFFRTCLRCCAHRTELMRFCAACHAFHRKLLVQYRPDTTSKEVTVDTALTLKNLPLFPLILYQCGNGRKSRISFRTGVTVSAR